MTKTAKEIARKLRCSLLTRGGAPECEWCAYCVKKKVPPKYQEVFEAEEILHCNREQICLDAAAKLDRLAEMEVAE